MPKKMTMRKAGPTKPDPVARGLFDLATMGDALIISVYQSYQAVLKLQAKLEALDVQQQQERVVIGQYSEWSATSDTKTETFQYIKSFRQVIWQALESLEATPEFMEEPAIKKLRVYMESTRSRKNVRASA